MTPRSASLDARPAGRVPDLPDKPGDDQFDVEMARILTDAADLRAERDRIRSTEDERLATAEAAAIENLIRTRARRATGSSGAAARSAVATRGERAR